MVLLKTTTADGKELVFTNITAWNIHTENVHGNGTGTAENGNTILDIRATNKVTIGVTFENLTLEQYTKYKEALDTETIQLTFWDGYYSTREFTVDSTDGELQKSKQRPNTVTNNRWTLSVTFTQIKMN